MSATQCPRCQADNEADQSFCHRCGYGLDRTGRLSSVGRPAHEWVGEVIRGKYKVLSVLGEGGFGTVFKVELLLLEDRRYFALKLLHPDLCRDEQFRRRFLREAAMAMELIHPHAIPVREFDQTDDEQLYFTMDYCEGEPLKNVIAREGFLTVNRAIPLVAQILSVLEAAHDKGIIHRDLKPENVFVVRNGGPEERALVGDFGLAKSIRGDFERQPSGSDLTKGGIVGTPKYMSPEQAKGEPLDGRSDLFSVGVILFELITGEMPPRLDARPRFAKSDGMEPASLTRLREMIPPNLVVPRAVLEAVARALEPRPAARYQSAAEFRDALEMLPTYTPTYVDHAPLRPPRRRRWFLPTAAVILIAALGAPFLFPEVRQDARRWLLAALDGSQQVPEPQPIPVEDDSNAAPSPATANGAGPSTVNGQPAAAGEAGLPPENPADDQVARPAPVTADPASATPVAAVAGEGAAGLPKTTLSDWVPYRVGDEMSFRVRAFSDDGSEIVRDDRWELRTVRSEPQRGLLVRDIASADGISDTLQEEWWWRTTDSAFSRTRGDGKGASTEVVLRWQEAVPSPSWQDSGYRYEVAPRLQDLRIGGTLFRQCLLVTARRTGSTGQTVEKRTYYQKQVGEVAFRVTVDGVTRLERFLAR